MEVNTSIFKAYDIRGVYPSDLNEEIAYRVGRAYARLVKEENPEKRLKLVVARDMRLSSPSLRDSLVKGLTDSGVDVVDIGLATTPTFYFAVAYYGFDGGIQISASHNPGKYNGFKMTRKKAIPVSGETGMRRISDWVVENNFEEVKEKGLVEDKPGVVEEAVRVLSEGIDGKKIKPFKIVVDTGNGMGALDIEAIFANLPCSLVRLNFELDGTFPAHEADPLKEENLEMVKSKLLEVGADMGIATDGDNDRIFFIDDKGKTVPPPVLRGLMAQIMLSEHPGSTVCYDIRPGKITQEMIEEAGGKAVVTRVGHSLIKETMIKTGAIFGGESSGHYFYQLPFGTFEAPIIFILRFLVYLSEKNLKLSELVEKYNKYSHSGEINSKVVDAKKKMEDLEKKYQGGKITKLDGITIEFQNWWFNVRSSNTEPLLRLNLEAINKEEMEKRRDELLDFIRS